MRASEVKGIERTGCYDWRTGKHAKWVGKVNRIRISELTAARIQRWKRRRLGKADADPASQRRAKSTINTILRNARSLFGKKVLPHVRTRLTVPNPHPLANVELFPRQSTHYVSRIEATPYFRPKTEEATGSVPVDAGLADWLAGAQEESSGSLVVNADRPAVPLSGYTAHRIRTHQKKLLD